MEHKTKLGKIILAILIAALFIAAWGWVGELDHHRYIEAHLTPKTKISY